MSSGRHHYVIRVVPLYEYIITMAFQVGASVLCAALFLSPLGGFGRSLLLLAIAAAHVVPAALHPELLTPRPSLDRDPYRHPFNATTDFDEQLLYAL